MKKENQRKRKQSESSCSSWSSATSNSNSSWCSSDEEEETGISNLESEDYGYNDDRLQSFLSDCEMLTGFHWFSIQERSLRQHNNSKSYIRNDDVSTYELSNLLHNSLVESWDDFMTQTAIEISPNDLIDMLKSKQRTPGLPTFPTITKKPLLPLSNKKRKLSTLDNLILKNQLNYDNKAFTGKEVGDNTHPSTASGKENQYGFTNYGFDNIQGKHCSISTMPFNVNRSKKSASPRKMFCNELGSDDFLDFVRCDNNDADIGEGVSNASSANKLSPLKLKFSYESDNDHSDKDLPMKARVEIDSYIDMSDNNTPMNSRLEPDSDIDFSDNEVPIKSGLELDSDINLSDNEVPIKSGLELDSDIDFSDNEVPMKSALELDSDIDLSGNDVLVKSRLQSNSGVDCLDKNASIGNDAEGLHPPYRNTRVDLSGNMFMSEMTCLEAKEDLEPKTQKSVKDCNPHSSDDDLPDHSYIFGEKTWPLRAKGIGQYSSKMQKSSASEILTKPSPFSSTSIEPDHVVNKAIQGEGLREQFKGSKPCSSKISYDMTKPKFRTELCNLNDKAIGKVMTDLSTVTKPRKVDIQDNGRENRNDKYKKGSILHSYSGNILAPLQRKYRNKHGSERQKSKNDSQCSKSSELRANHEVLRQSLSGKKSVNAFNLIMANTKKLKKKKSLP